MWNRKGGTTWEVHRSGFLWLAQFGDMSSGGKARPSDARIDIDARKDAILFTPGSGCSIATWARPAGCYVSAAMDGLPADRWREMTFAFTPQGDGEFTLKIMGSHEPIPGTDESIPIWVYSDDVRIDGAELVNGSFEAPGTGGRPHGWIPSVRQGLWIHDPELAAEGEYLIKTTHNQRFAQQIKVTAGRTVTISLKVRGVGE